MAHDAFSPPAPQRGSGNSRWEQLLENVSGLLPAGPISVLVDGDDRQAAMVAGRLAGALRAAGRPCQQLTGNPPPAGEPATRPGTAAPTVRLAHTPGRPGVHWNVVIWLRTPPGLHHRNGSRANGEARADIVIDLHDPGWPVIRHVAGPLGGRLDWYLSETRAFFAPRAATWDTRFGPDLPAYAAAIAEAGLPIGGVVIDVGCGTGRALPALRQAVGPDGTVIAADLTPEMLHQAHALGHARHAGLVVADARQLPLAGESVDIVFAAGLIMHLPDAEAGLRQFARVTRPGGLLILFHPSGRAALAARHGRTLCPGEPLAETPLRQSAASTGWRLTTYDDPPHRFLAIATRL